MIPFTILTAANGVCMTKVMSLNPDGTLHKSTRANLSRGSFQVQRTPNLESLAEELSTLNSSQCVTWGQPVNESGLLCTQDDEARREQGAIPRDRKHFAWNTGPGILMLDHDGTPGRSLTGDEFRELLLSVCPHLATAPMLWRPSVSAGLMTAEGHELTKLDRHRLYIPVTDARRIPEAGKALESLLWAAGHGWCELSSSGQRLLRCPVDTSVWQPERIDFCAPPELRDGICRPESTHRVYGDPSGLFDLGALIDSVDSDVKSRTQAERRKARNAKQDEAHEVALVWAEKHATSLAARRGIKTEQALLCLTRAATTRVLMGDFELTASDGAVVSVSEILDQPARWHGKRFYDPLDPDEDNRVAVARLMGTKPTIFSHRHGGVSFELRRQTVRIEVGAGLRIESTDHALAVLQERGATYDFGTSAIAYVTALGRVVVPNRHWLTDHLGRMCEFYSTKLITDRDGNVTGEKEVPENPPQWLAEAILAKHGERGFAMLTGVVTAPTLRPDGSVLDTPGYDTATQLVYVPLSTPIPNVRSAPTPEAAVQALERLFAPFKSFPFADAESVGVFLAALISGCLRPSLHTCPGFGFDAPAAGSGKTLLARCVGWLATGEDAAVLPPTTDEEETRKRLFAGLLSGSRVLLWDNIRVPLGNAALDAFLTSPVFSDRVLGKSETCSLPNRALFLATGNNLVLTGDTFRRVLMCRIDPGVETPYKREFEVNPLDYIRQHRLEMVTDALTVVLAWITAGRPRAVSGNTASFEQWDALVRQPLMWLRAYIKDADIDYRDPLAGLERAALVNPESTAINDVFTAIRQQFGGRAVTAKEIVAAAERNTLLTDALEDALPAKKAGKFSTWALGNWLARHIDRIVQGKRLQRTSGQGGIFRWRVEVIDVKEPPQTHSNPPNPPFPWSEPPQPPITVGLVGFGGFVSADRVMSEEER